MDLILRWTNPIGDIVKFVAVDFKDILIFVVDSDEIVLGVDGKFNSVIEGKNILVEFFWIGNILFHLFLRGVDLEFPGNNIGVGFISGEGDIVVGFPGLRSSTAEAAGEQGCEEENVAAAVTRPDQRVLLRAAEIDHHALGEIALGAFQTFDHPDWRNSLPAFPTM